MPLPGLRLTLNKPIIAFTKRTRGATTIPSGSVVEVVHPAAGGLVEVQWEGEIHTVPLSTLLRACADPSETYHSAWGVD